VRMHKKDVEKITLKTHYKYYEFKNMSIYLTNVSIIF
jgi:hypothetical protein